MVKNQDELKLTINHLSELPSISEKIIDFAKDQKIWLFHGELGSGKTTIIQSVCEQFGVIDYVNSPTFTIINEYESENGERFCHFDFYRLDNINHIAAIGVEEYFDSGDYCFIEWPEVGKMLIPENHLSIKINVDRDQKRILELTRYD